MPVRVLRPRLRALGLLAAGALVVAGCGSKDKKTSTTTTKTSTTTIAKVNTDDLDHFTVYVSLNFEGLSKPSADSIFNAAQLALEQARARAGGLPVQLVALDDGLPTTGTTDPGAIVQNAHTATGDASTIAYIGDQGSGDTARSLPITNRAGILQVSATNTAPGLTQSGGKDKSEPARYYPSGVRTFGRLVPTDKVQAAAQVQLMSLLSCRSVGIIDDGGLFGSGLAQQVATIGTQKGLTITKRATANLETGNGFDAVGTVAGTGPGCVVFAGSSSTKVINLWNRLHATLPNAQLIGPDSLANAEFALRIGAAGATTYLTTPTVASKYFNEAGQDFLTTYQQRFGGTPDPSGVYGYETMRAVIAAIDAAGTRPTRANVVAQFFAIRNRPSALGNFSITSTGDSTLTQYGSYRIENGALAFDRVLHPSLTTTTSG